MQSKIRKILTIILLFAALGFSQEGARYLIITHDSLYAAIEPLAQWKHKKGMKTKIARISETGSSNTQIRDYIVNAYNTWNPRPEFLLLVGSPALLPSFLRNYPPPSYETDNEYANMTGDLRAELCYGRFPAKNPFQCSVMVAKTLSFERTPFLSDSIWLRAGTIIINEDGDPDDTIYWNDARFVVSLMRSAGYIKIDTFSGARGHTASDVITAVTEGRSFLLYRGSAYGCWPPPFRFDPGVINNNNKLPVICSFTCATMTLAALESMVGDAWIKSGTPGNPKGAVAFVGNTRGVMNVAAIRSAMTHGFFNSVFRHLTRNLGQAVLDGKTQIWDEFLDRHEYEAFNLLGDPELCLWTAVPKPLEVIYEPTIPLAPQNFVVTVRSDSVPVPNALVCLMKGTEIYAYAYSDSLGQVSLSINPLSTGTMTVTVTAQNCLPHEGSTQVLPAGIEIQKPAVIMKTSSRLECQPNPFSNQTIIRYRGENLKTAGLRIYDCQGQLVKQFELSQANKNIVWDGQDEQDKEIKPGVYFAVLEKFEFDSNKQKLRLLKVK